MDILYVSRLCSERSLSGLMALPAKPPLQEQKFHGLLARGLASRAHRVVVLSVLPAQARIDGLPPPAAESDGQLVFRYLLSHGIPVLSHGSVFVRSFAASLGWMRTRGDGPRCVVCDVLDLSVSAGALAAAKVSGVPTLALVTDVPAGLHDYIGGGETTFARAYRALATFCLTRYSGYLLLTEAMNDLANPRARPHVVMEGLVDAAMAAVDNTLERKAPGRVVLYAGALFRKYGVATLLEAFQRVAREDARLWVYGGGELEGAVQEAAERDARISYRGVRPNAEVVDAEIQATLLVNPRPSSAEFTRYSFPSKNLEYMVSGTPVLTTRLPGMPAEYLDHVFTFEDESVEGLARAMSGLLERPREELHRLGLGAKAFVLAWKNHLAQGARVHRFLAALAHGEPPPSAPPGVDGTRPQAPGQEAEESHG